MTLSRCSIYTGIALVAALMLSSAVQAGVVTVDIAEKAATTDTDSLEAKGVRVVEGQVGVYIYNTTLEPQTLQLKLNGVTEPNYDVYVDGNYTRTYSADDLKNGIELSIDGTIADPDMMHCLKTLMPKLEAEYDRLQETQGEAKRIWHTVRQAADWTRSGISLDTNHRAISVIVAPSGRMLQRMTYPTKLTSQQAVMGLWRACRNLQDARDRMYDNIKDPQLRNEAVVALTPVTFNATYSVKDGKPHVDAVITNDSNLPIIGDITLALPKGWSTNADSLDFSDLKPAKSFDLAFDLVPPTKDAAAPDSVPIAANVIIVQGAFEARMKLRMVAVKTVVPNP